MDDRMIRLDRRTPQSQIDWLVEQVSLLVAQRGAMQREIDVLRTRVEHLEQHDLT